MRDNGLDREASTHRHRWGHGDQRHGVGVFLCLDVGKQTHHRHGLTPAGKTVFDKALPNSGPKLRAIFDKLKAKFGIVLVIVDQPASIGALPLTVARDADCQIAYPPGLAMRRIADLYPGEAKTDAKDAAVIADAARTMLHTLRTLDLADEVPAELTMLVGFDQDLAGEDNRTSNRIRGLRTQFLPSLERVLGPRLDHQAVTWLLQRYGSPQALREAGRRRLVEVVRPRATRMAERLIDAIFTALDEQTVTVPSTLDVITPPLAKSLAAVQEQRRALEARIEALLEAHPLSQVLTSVPAIGVRTTAGGFMPGTTHPCLPGVLASGQRHPTGYGERLVLTVRRELHERRAAAVSGTTIAPTRVAHSRTMPPALTPVTHYRVTPGPLPGVARHGGLERESSSINGQHRQLRAFTR
ncbi:hypothetical protein RKD47_006720 [Streptomyces albogriseolus]